MAAPRSTRPGTRSSGRRTREDGDDPASTRIAAITSITAAGVGVLALAIALDAIAAAILASISGLVLSGLVTMADRRTPGGRALASCLAVLGGFTTAAALGLATVSGGLGVETPYRLAATVAIGLATFGATATITGGIGGGAVRSAIPVAVGTPVPIVVTAAAYTAEGRSARTTFGPDRLVTEAQGLLGQTIEPGGTMVAVASFVVLVSSTCWAVAFVVPKLPIVTLVPRDRRDRARERIGRVARLAFQAGAAVVFVAMGMAVLSGLLDAEPVPYLVEVVPPIEAALIALATNAIARGIVLAVLLGTALLYLVSKVPALRRVQYSSLTGWAPVFTGGVLLVPVIVKGYPIAFERWVAPGLESIALEGQYVTVPFGGAYTGARLHGLLSPPSGIAIAAGAVASVLASVVAVCWLVWMLGAIDLLSGTGAPGSLAAGGLVAGGIFASVAGAGTPFVAVTVVAAIVAWDSAVYGASMADELGLATGARQPVIAHVSGSVAVGSLAVAVAFATTRGLAAITVATGTIIAIALTIALLAVVIVLKRRAVRGAARAASSGGRPSNRSAADRRSDPPSAATEPDSANAETGEEAASTSMAHLDADTELSTETFPPALEYELERLGRAGYRTVGDLRRADADDASAIPGVSPSRMAQFRAVLTADGSSDPGRAEQPATSNKDG